MNRKRLGQLLIGGVFALCAAAAAALADLVAKQEAQNHSGSDSLSKDESQTNHT